MLLRGLQINAGLSGLSLNPIKILVVALGKKYFA